MPHNPYCSFIICTAGKDEKGFLHTSDFMFVSCKNWLP